MKTIFYIYTKPKQDKKTFLYHSCFIKLAKNEHEAKEFFQKNGYEVKSIIESKG